MAVRHTVTEEVVETTDLAGDLLDRLMAGPRAPWEDDEETTTETNTETASEETHSTPPKAKFWGWFSGVLALAAFCATLIGLTAMPYYSVDVDRLERPFGPLLVYTVDWGVGPVTLDRVDAILLAAEGPAAVGDDMLRYETELALQSSEEDLSDLSTVIVDALEVSGVEVLEVVDLSAKTYTGIEAGRAGGPPNVLRVVSEVVAIGVAAAVASVLLGRSLLMSVLSAGIAVWRLWTLIQGVASTTQPILGYGISPPGLIADGQGAELVSVGFALLAAATLVPSAIAVARVIANLGDSTIGKLPKAIRSWVEERTEDQD